MRYYEYISERKVSMLFPQLKLDKNVKRSAELKAKFPWIFESAFKVEDEIRDPHWTTKAELIEAHLIEAGVTGPLEHGKQYILDTMSFWWGPSWSTAGSNPGTVVWFGATREHY